MTPIQTDLFETPPALPAGLVYRPQLIDPADERELLAHLPDLPFEAFQFHGFLGRRRVVSFGARYDSSAQQLAQAPPLPPFLEPLRAQAAAFAGLSPSQLAHALVTEYAPGAGIGWHRDRPEFDQVIGVSLAAPCRFRLRRRDGGGWRRAAFTAGPRSAYLLSGEARREWEHSIPPLDALRYSVTFRSLSRPSPAMVRG